MTIRITGPDAPRTADRTTRTTSTPTTTAAHRAVFTRTALAAASPMEGKRTLGDAQLAAMGAEIVRLYKEKVVDAGGRRLAVKSPEGDWSIRGVDLENLVIHTKDGLIQLRPDGMPMRNAAVPVRSWEAVEVGLKRALETLRDVGKPPAAANSPISA